LQPDTVIPDLSNPQSWNRYSYVTNRPVDFSDPSGHVMTKGDGGGSQSVDCKKYPQYCNGNDPKTGDELRDLRNKKKRDTLDIYTKTKSGHFVSWEGEKNIPPDYWQFTLDEFGKAAHSRASSDWKFIRYITAYTFDSDFFNEDTIFTKPLTGRGCFDDNKCYDRSEINYFAQGELWAAYGVTKDEGHDIIKSWKESKCFWRCERNDLQEEYDMFDVGYRHYQELYPRQNRSNE
jgi:hypothetical protein